MRHSGKIEPNQKKQRQTIVETGSEMQFKSISWGYNELVTRPSPMTSKTALVSVMVLPCCVAFLSALYDPVSLDLPTR